MLGPRSRPGSRTRRAQLPLLPAGGARQGAAGRGRLGELRHYRALYLQDYQTAGGQPRSSGGAGAVLDYSPRRHAPVPRRRAGSVAGMTSKLVPTSTTRSSRCSSSPPDSSPRWRRHASRPVGRGTIGFELNGSDGSIWWDMEDEPAAFSSPRTNAEGLGGFRDVLVTSPSIRSWPSGGRRGTCSAGELLRPRVARLPRGSPRRACRTRPTSELRGRIPRGRPVRAIHTSAREKRVEIAGARAAIRA